MTDTTVSVRLPWSAVRDTMWETRFGLRPLRFVACICPKCGYRNRVIVRKGGRSPTISQARREYGYIMVVCLFNPSEKDVPVWTTGEDHSTGERLAQCGCCMERWSISMHARRGVPTPLRDDGPNIGEQVFALRNEERELP